jgi:DNA-binding MarR family transcriptional regulator/GNAT superfamily N-acetyltransferase
VHRIDRVRSFNRFYTRHIGVLRAGLLDSPFTLPEARVLYELGQRKQCTATELGADLDLDPGYLSRLLDGLKRKFLLERRPSSQDARQKLLLLTAKGRKAFTDLDARSRKDVEKMLAGLPGAGQAHLVQAMGTVESLLEGKKQAGEIVLRPHRPGDMGWVVHRHGAVYAAEYGWDGRFEALVAGITKEFIENLDVKRERCWIAERDGESLGSVFLVKQSESVAKLRLLLVEPGARGLGLGRRLVDECIRFARERGYKKLVLWTQSNLAAARSIYRETGFELKKKEIHQSFGVKLTGEYWELNLKGSQVRL